MPETLDHTTAIEIGHYYLVPHVTTNKRLWLYSLPRLIPVIGPNHEDAEFIHFPEKHWHIDWRFVSRRFINAAAGGVRQWRALGTPICVKNTTGVVTMHRRKCRRAMPIMPGCRVPWLKKLEAAYAGCRLNPGLICPHRGLPLKGCPVKDDVVVCPGHGLAWNVATGELVPGAEYSV